MCVWVSRSLKACLLFSCHSFVPLLFLEISCMIFVTFYFNFWFFPWRCCRFCFDGLGWKWTLSGWPRNVEKLTKVFPFADSMITWALVLDLHLLQNSLNVENSKASSLLFIMLVLDAVLSEQKIHHSETKQKHSSYLALEATPELNINSSDYL